jgi:hypothetical protein
VGEKGLLVDEVAFRRYRLLSRIGQGGLGKDSEAHDTVTDRDVVNETLATRPGAEPGHRQRFHRPAHTARSMDSPKNPPRRPSHPTCESGPGCRRRRRAAQPPARMRLRTKRLGART